MVHVEDQVHEGISNQEEVVLLVYVNDGKEEEVERVVLETKGLPASNNFVVAKDYFFTD